MWCKKFLFIKFSLCLSLVQALPSSCFEVMSNKTNKIGVYLLQLPTSDLPPFSAYCTLDGYTIIQRRRSGNENFFRNWQDYKNGFGDVEDDYWLGLEHIHAMTKDQPQTLQIMLQRFDGLTQVSYYNIFEVESEAKDYKLIINNYGGAGGNALIYSKDMKFSTFDRNNCEGRDNFADESQSGFWFSPKWNQASVNLNGPFHQFADRESKPGLYWNDLLQTVYMAIKPRGAVLTA